MTILKDITIISLPIIYIFYMVDKLVVSSMNYVKTLTTLVVSASVLKLTKKKIDDIIFL